MTEILSTSGSEPVAAAECALAARLDGDAATELSAYIAGAITAARQSAEQITGRRYIATVERATFVDWPDVCTAIPVHAPTACAVSYWAAGAWQSLAGSAYLYDQAPIGSGTVLAPVTGTSWPTLGDRPVGPRVRIDLTSGGASVSECVKLYIKAQVAGWINSPGALERNAMVPNPLFANILDADKLWV